MHEARNSWLAVSLVQLLWPPEQHKPQGGLRPHPPCPLFKGQNTGSQLNIGSQLVLHFRWHLRWWRSRLMLTWRRLPCRSAHWPRRKWREIQIIVIGLCFKGCSKDKKYYLNSKRFFFGSFLYFAKKSLKIVKNYHYYYYFYIQKMNNWQNLLSKKCFLWLFFLKTYFTNCMSLVCK